MATHQDVLDAIARVRAATADPGSWSAGLSGEDIAVVTNPLSTPAALGAVMSKIIAAHPDSFGGVSPAEHTPARGAAADAVREARTALAAQKSTAAQVDLKVITAVLNAQEAHAAGVGELDRLQREIEAAVAAATDLDTPAGARAFQGYLVDKTRDIRAVVDKARLDSTSKAELAEALSALYASAAPDPLPAEPSPTTPPPPTLQPQRAQADEPDGETTSRQAGEEHRELPETERDSTPAPTVMDPPPWYPESYPQEDYLPPSVAEPLATPPPPAAPVTAPALPMPTGGWGGGLPGGAPVAGAVPPLPDLSGQGPFGLAPDSLRRAAEPDPRLKEPDASTDQLEPEAATEAAPDDLPEDPRTVELPGGDVVPNAELAGVITAAVAGTPIPDAFQQQGIASPAPGTPVAIPLDPHDLLPGDIGLFTDRYALSLGNGKALMDTQIQNIASVSGPGFLGWQHPPEPDRHTGNPVPEVPEPTRPVETAPS
ncbi:MAG: DUF4226 domain-containing protein [Mycobacterium sp.]